jgi:hypothetical protein
MLTNTINLRHSCYKGPRYTRHFRAQFCIIAIKRYFENVIILFTSLNGQQREAFKRAKHTLHYIYWPTGH